MGSLCVLTAQQKAVPRKGKAYEDFCDRSRRTAVTDVVDETIRRGYENRRLGEYCGIRDDKESHQASGMYGKPRE